jgi:protein-tyrosine phosphatase
MADSYAVEAAEGEAAPAPVTPSRRRGAGRTIVRVLAGSIAFLLIGNLAILAASRWMRITEPLATVPASVTGVKNVAAVDAGLWRGAAPTGEGYRSLAAAGVTRVVDLRAEDNVDVDAAWLESLGVEYVRIPVRDGQVPTSTEVRQFLGAVQTSEGTVFVHCGAGVGRTGAMSAAWLVASGEAGATEALRRNLSVGPPSLEQLAWVANLGVAGFDKPNAAIVALSRTLDAPRRLWSRFGI